jgi:hypothetical protein
MIKLILILLGLCNHKWRLVISNEIRDGNNFYWYTRKECVCEKCGEWKTFTIK